MVGLNLETKHSLTKNSWTPGVTGLNYAKPMRENQRFIVPVQGLFLTFVETKMRNWMDPGLKNGPIHFPEP